MERVPTHRSVLYNNCDEKSMYIMFMNMDFYAHLCCVPQWQISLWKKKIFIHLVFGHFELVKTHYYLNTYMYIVYHLYVTLNIYIVKLK